MIVAVFAKAVADSYRSWPGTLGGYWTGRRYRAIVLSLVGRVLATAALTGVLAMALAFVVAWFHQSGGGCDPGDALQSC